MMRKMYWSYRNDNFQRSAFNKVHIFRMLNVELLKFFCRSMVNSFVAQFKKKKKMNDNSIQNQNSWLCSNTIDFDKSGSPSQKRSKEVGIRKPEGRKKGPKINLFQWLDKKLPFEGRDNSVCYDYYVIVPTTLMACYKISFKGSFFPIRPP